MISLLRDWKIQIIHISSTHVICFPSKKYSYFLKQKRSCSKRILNRKLFFYLFPPPLSGLGTGNAKNLKICYLCIGGVKQVFFFIIYKMIRQIKLFKHEMSKHIITKMSKYYTAKKYQKVQALTKIFSKTNNIEVPQIELNIP